MKFLKVGRVAIITRGRYAGKKVRRPAKSLFGCPSHRSRPARVFGGGTGRDGWTSTMD